MFPFWKGQMDDLSICLLLCKLTLRDNNTPNEWNNNNNNNNKENPVIYLINLQKPTNIFIIDSYPDPFLKMFYKYETASF